jgi:RHS repeat-associated protein
MNMYRRQLGLVRFGARDYDPEIGRWVAKDASRFSTGITNLMAYVSNDPINLIDHTGLAEVCSRPLSGTDFTAGPLRHDQIFYENGENVGFFPKGVLTDNEHQRSDYSECRYIGDDSDVRAAVDELNGTKFTNTNYNLVTHNCQEFARAVEERAKEIADPREPVEKFADFLGGLSGLTEALDRRQQQ